MIKREPLEDEIIIDYNIWKLIGTKLFSKYCTTKFVNKEKGIVGQKYLTSSVAKKLIKEICKIIQSEPISEKKIDKIFLLLDNSTKDEMLDFDEWKLALSLLYKALIE